MYSRTDLLPADVLGGHVPVPQEVRSQRSGWAECARDLYAVLLTSGCAPLLNAVRIRSNQCSCKVVDRAKLFRLYFPVLSVVGQVGFLKAYHSRFRDESESRRHRKAWAEGWSPVLARGLKGYLKHCARFAVHGWDVERSLRTPTSQMEPLYEDLRAAALEYAKAINSYAASIAAQVCRRQEPSPRR